MEVIYCSSAYEAKNRAKESLRSFLARVKESEKSVLLLFSGGSAFEILQGINRNILGECITCGVLDERYSKDKTVSNFEQLSSTLFYGEALAAGCHFIDTRVRDGESLEDLALRFENALIDWRCCNKEGAVFATMGVGKDGHTAGIMPNTENSAQFRELFENNDRWMIGYHAGDKNLYSERVTVTLLFLRNEVDAVVAYAVGEEKKDAIKRVCAKEGTLFETPARIMREMKKVNFYTDVTIK